MNPVSEKKIERIGLPDQVTQSAFFHSLLGCQCRQSDALEAVRKIPLFIE